MKCMLRHVLPGVWVWTSCSKTKKQRQEEKCVKRRRRQESLHLSWQHEPEAKETSNGRTVVTWRLISMRRIFDRVHSLMYGIWGRFQSVSWRVWRWWWYFSNRMMKASPSNGDEDSSTTASHCHYFYCLVSYSRSPSRVIHSSYVQHIDEKNVIKLNELYLTWRLKMKDTAIFLKFLLLTDLKEWGSVFLADQSFLFASHSWDTTSSMRVKYSRKPWNSDLELISVKECFPVDSMFSSIHVIQSKLLWVLTFRLPFYGSFIWPQEWAKLLRH